MAMSWMDVILTHKELSVSSQNKKKKIFSSFWKLNYSLIYNETGIEIPILHKRE